MEAEHGRAAVAFNPKALPFVPLGSQPVISLAALLAASGDARLGPSGKQVAPEQHGQRGGLCKPRGPKGRKVPVPTKLRPASPDGAKAGKESPAEQRSTLIVRNIPCLLTQKDAVETLDGLGFRGTYDYIYMPRRSPKTVDWQGNVGYMFVNFTRAEFAKEFQATVSGTKFGPIPTEKVCEVVEARKQGSGRILWRLQQRCRSPTTISTMSV